MEPNSAEELCEPALNTHLNIVPPNGGESWGIYTPNPIRHDLQAALSGY